MALVVGDAILSATISHIVNKLTSPELLKVARRGKIHADIKKLETSLQIIHAVLDDAEEKQMSSRAVKLWLDQLRDSAFDVEDFLDEFFTEILRQKLQKEQQASSSKVSLAIPGFFTALNPSNLAFNFKMDSKITRINARLQEVLRKKNDLELRENGSGGLLKNKSLKRLPSTSLVDAFYVCGRDKDKEEIIKLLFSDEGCDEYGISVIAIVGMGGVGKTTLAQLVYNDEQLTNSFDLKVWCCVSEDFDVVRVTRTILEAIGSGGYDARDLNLLQLRLREKLVGRRFLIVLDDVWNENYDDWTVLRRPFQVTSPRSKIIVTTRNRGVASTMSAFPGYLLKELSFDDSLSLFAKHALGRPSFSDVPDLQEIGQKIVRRCSGLPLAVKTLGGLLRTKPSLDEWESVLNSKLWDISEHKSGIVPALRLSYYHLPSHLKQLFVFCSILPKDYEFYKDELVLLWMAEGFLPGAGGKKRMEALDSCFNELVSRSFFQQSSSKERFLMHHLISDLAQSIAGEMCVNLNDKLEHNKLFPDLGKTRHMSFTRRTYEVLQRFKDLGKLKHLRTLIALRLYSSPWVACCYLSNNVLQEAVPKLRHLRVLSLSGYCIIALPNSIGDLKLLRYLNLSQSKIKRLPESVSTLINLETLKLYGCSELAKLPQGTGKLINLCHLDITDTDKLHEMPSWMGNLTGLQRLSKFIVGKKDGNGIEELKELKNLQGRLSILALHNVMDARHAVDANLRDKHRLKGLELEWSNSDFKDEKLEREMLVLNSLQPHTNLEELEISCYGGTQFPSWVGHPSFAEIVRLKLSRCCKCAVLPPLGRLPLLRDLCIQGLDAVKNVGPEFYGDGSSVKHFPSLETLKFQDMREWQFWRSSAGADEEEFPSLSELTLWNCPNLIGKLPSCLASCVKVTIAKCPMLVASHEKLPVLRELKLEECNEVTFKCMVDNSSLTTLKLRSMSELTCLDDHFLRSQGALKVLMISDFPKLNYLVQNRAGLENLEDPQCVSLTEIGLPTSTRKSSNLSGCDKLELLPTHKVHRLPSLEDLCIESCPKLVSIWEAGLLPSLKHLVLRGCKALKSLPDGISKCPLEDLEIEECPLLKCFPGGMLPMTLKGLKIRYCAELWSLPDGMMHNENSSETLCHFEHLEIIGCPSIKYFPTGKLPPRLKTLKIWDCSQLEPLSERMLHDDMSLQYIAISDCEALTSLPECLSSFKHLTELYLSNCSVLKCFPGVALFLPNFRTLNIYNCRKLKSLPSEMRKLTSLQELTICSCPALESFPNGDLPPNLTSLEIWDCDKLDGSLSKWNLQSLACLRDFSIAGGCFSGTATFPDEECLLPTTLTSVWIARLPKLESLSTQLQSLASLEELEIVDCPKLKSLPKECLPRALGRFSVRDCPLLTQRCSKEKGMYWPLISHVPCLEIDGNDM